MPNYPTTIPAQYASDKYLAAAYESGWQRGHGFACHNVPRIGEYIFSDSYGRALVTADNVRDIHQAACFDAESHSRDYSPFEFIAYELNDSEDSEALWEAFDAGIADSIFADLETYTDADYGIVTEPA